MLVKPDPEMLATVTERVAGDWGVSIYQETSVESVEAEALVNRQLRLFPPDVRVIDRRP